ncbi:protein of unknown function [Cyanobium sp. NIES-981]|nr:protein of unknown function [Cyanobium sp. NIES-981]
MMAFPRIVTRSVESAGVNVLNCRRVQILIHGCSHHRYRAPTLGPLARCEQASGHPRRPDPCGPSRLRPLPRRPHSRRPLPRNPPTRCRPPRSFAGSADSPATW